MSERSLLNIYRGPDYIGSFSSAWGASAYGLAEQIEIIARAVINIPADDSPSWGQNIFDKATVAGSDIYEPVERNSLIEQASCWIIDIDLNSNVFDGTQVLDLYEDLSEIDDDKARYDGRLDSLSWEQLTTFSSILKMMEGEAEYWILPEDRGALHIS